MYFLHELGFGFAIPRLMKSIQIDHYGNAAELKLADTPCPEIDQDQILVRIVAAGVNPVDWKIRAGYFKEFMSPSFPLTLGQDFAGEVAEVGKEAKSFKIGERVFGFALGSYSEFAIASISEVASLPDSIAFETAASLPTPGLTALQLIRDRVQAKPGMKILIHGAAGAVGTFAISMAKNAGAQIIATAAHRDFDYLKSLGAKQLIDYKKERFETQIRNVDAAVDLVGGDTLARTYSVVKKGGIVVSTVEPTDETLTQHYGIQGSHIVMKRNASDLNELVKMVEKGILKPRIAQVLNLADAKKAQEISEKGQALGKLILKVAA
jgi:NADPH:quinone reductase-like Zn-dependent oxidoreductase